MSRRGAVEEAFDGDGDGDGDWLLSVMDYAVNLW